MARKRGNGQGTLFQRQPGGAWIASWYGHDGKRHTKSTRMTDKRAAERLLTKWTTDATLRREGAIDPRTEKLAQQSRRPLSEHLADFAKDVTAKGATAQHVALVTARVTRVIEGCEFQSWADLSASRVMDFLNGLRADKVTKNEAGEVVKTKRGISLQTFNFYLAAVKQFARWMVKDRRAADNALAHLRGLNVRTDRRHDRRALTAEELRTLIDTTHAGPERYGIPGPERAMLYRLAAESGLRAGELRSLTRASFEVDADPPTVNVAASYSKRRRADTLPLRPETAEKLAAHLETKAPAAPAFAMPKADHQARLFRMDLAAAGIPYRDDADRVADFHCLRHTFISALTAGGVHPKVAQSLARHSSIELTMGRYSHLYAGDEVAALMVLPNLSADLQLASTGTDGTPAAIQPAQQ